RTMTSLGASTAMLGVLLSQILGISRMMLAMGRRKDLMPIFQRVHPIYKVPHIGIFITGLIIAGLCIIGRFEFILASAAFTILLYYTITNLAALRQKKEFQRYGKAIPILGLTGCLIMAFSLDSQVIISGIILLIIGYILRFVIHRALK